MKEMSVDMAQLKRKSKSGITERFLAGADLVVAPREPYPFAERHVPELSAFGPVVLVDGRDLFWWGARTGDALGRLAAALA